MLFVRVCVRDLKSGKIFANIYIYINLLVVRVRGLKSGKIFNRSSGPLELEALCGSSQNYGTLMMLIFNLFLPQMTSIFKN